MGNRVLFMSGSAGLGHVVRDLAIVREMRRIEPEVEISWLAAPPAKEYLQEKGEKLLPEANRLADLTGAAESMSSPRGVNLTFWALSVRGDWAANAHLYFDLMKTGRFDIAVGDETYELPMALARDPKLPRYPLAVIWDFVGLDSVTWHPKELMGVYAFNRIWSRCGAATGFTPILIGQLEDISDKRFGPLLPNRRDFVKENCKVVGYVLPFDPADYGDSQALKRELGYGEGPLIACCIGGTSIGKGLLELCGAAFPLMHRAQPGLQMVLFCGPRVAPESLTVPDGVEVRGFVPDLCRHLAACDAAITQAGGTTTLELTALKRPFLYFPLEDHFEQMRAVSDRLRRHGAGEPAWLSRTTPTQLAERTLALLGRPVQYAELPLEAARRTGEIILGLA